MKINISYFLERIDEVPSFSGSVREIIDLFNKGEVNVKNLEQTLSKDVGITTQVLRIANSPFFGFSGQIKSLKDACMILGLPSVYNLVTAAAVLERFPGDKDSIINYDEFWQHSIAVAITTKGILEKANKISESAFLAGLIHDIGKLMLDMFFREDYLKIIEYQKEHQCLMRQAEKAVLGLDHAELGAMMLKSWKLPEEIVVTTRNHHNLNLGQYSHLVSSVRIADNLVKGLDIGNSDGNYIFSMSPKALPNLELTFDDLYELLPVIENHINSSEIWN